MKDLVIMCLTCAILAGQYQLGLRRKKLFGALLPAIHRGVHRAHPGRANAGAAANRACMHRGGRCNLVHRLRQRRFV